jgi:hypothetical protein
MATREPVAIVFKVIRRCDKELGREIVKVTRMLSGVGQARRKRAARADRTASLAGDEIDHGPQVATRGRSLDDPSGRCANCRCW